MQHDMLNRAKTLLFGNKTMRQYRTRTGEASTGCGGRLACSVGAAGSSDLSACSTVTTVWTSGTDLLLAASTTDCRRLSVATCCTAVISTDNSTSGCPPAAPFNDKIPTNKYANHSKLSSVPPHPPTNTCTKMFA